jgi:dTDP-glucose pyrophosphorylase
VRDVVRLIPPVLLPGALKALLPVGNRPLISYPIKNLSDAGIKSCIVVGGAWQQQQQQQGLCH